MGEINGATQIVAFLALVLGPGGAAWVGVRIALNGLRERVREMGGEMKTIREDVAGVRKDVTNVRERLARIEGASRP